MNSYIGSKTAAQFLFCPFIEFWFASHFKYLMAFGILIFPAQNRSLADKMKNDPFSIFPPLLPSLHPTYY